LYHELESWSKLLGSRIVFSEPSQVLIQRVQGQQFRAIERLIGSLRFPEPAGGGLPAPRLLFVQAFSMEVSFFQLARK
jgi:hypothetical protein